MKSEIYKVAMPNKALVFVVSSNSNRASELGKLLNQIGALEDAPQMFVMETVNDLAEKVRAAVGELLEGELIYVVRPNGDPISLQAIVRPRTDGGIVVR